MEFQLAMKSLAKSFLFAFQEKTGNFEPDPLFRQIGFEKPSRVLLQRIQSLDPQRKPQLVTKTVFSIKGLPRICLEDPHRWQFGRPNPRAGPSALSS